MSPFLRIGIIISLFVVSSCARAPKVGTTPDTGFYGPPAGDPTQTEKSGIGIETTTASPRPDPYGPQLPQKKSVILVLGPGMARAFAYAGVLRALEENGIPVGGIVGVEMGALLGALYSGAKTINEFEWQLMRFKDTSFGRQDSMLSRFFKNEGISPELKKAVQKVFGDRTVENLNLPTRIGIVSQEKDEYLLEKSGKISDLVLSSLKTPETAPGQRTANAENPFPVRDARVQLGELIVLVDVLTQPPSRLTAQDKAYLAQAEPGLSRANTDIQNATLVLRPNLSSIGYYDFSQKTAAAFQGARAVQSALPQLKALCYGETGRSTQ